ncbi:hypothetical protein ACJ41O_006482 [Fusarium nematophilum]
MPPTRTRHQWRTYTVHPTPRDPKNKTQAEKRIDTFRKLLPRDKNEWLAELPNVSIDDLHHNITLAHLPNRSEMPLEDVLTGFIKHKEETAGSFLFELVFGAACKVALKHGIPEDVVFNLMKIFWGEQDSRHLDAAVRAIKVVDIVVQARGTQAYALPLCQDRLKLKGLILNTSENSLEYLKFKIDNHPIDSDETKKLYIPSLVCELFGGQLRYDHLRTRKSLLNLQPVVTISPAERDFQISSAPMKKTEVNIRCEQDQA